LITESLAICGPGRAENGGRSISFFAFALNFQITRKSKYLGDIKAEAKSDFAFRFPLSHLFF